MEKSSIEFLLNSLILLFLLLYFSNLFILRLRQELKIRNFKENEFNKNVNISAIGIPHPFRELDESEKSVLNKRINEMKKGNKGLLGFAVFNIFLASLIILNLITNFVPEFINNIEIYMYLLFLYIIVLSVKSIFSKPILFGNHNLVYMDLRAPVFKVGGKLFKKIHELGNQDKNSKKTFIINGVEFGSDENSEIEDFWERFQNGDEISVEYSPFTKHIWKIERV